MLVVVFDGAIPQNMREGFLKLQKQVNWNTIYFGQLVYYQDYSLILHCTLDSGLVVRNILRSS